MGELDLVYKQEQETYGRTQLFLGDAVLLVEETLGLYRLLGDFIGNCGFGSVATSQENQPSIKIGAAVFVKCLMACRYQLIAGALAILRGHLADSQSYTRKAIEFCAFGLHCLDCPQDASVWINAGNSKTAYQKYRSTFNIMKLLTALKAKMGDLLERYEWLSTEVHGSYFSVVKQIYPKQIDEGTLFHFAYFDVERDWNLLPSTLLATVRTHFEVVQALGKAATVGHARFESTRWIEAVAMFFRLYDKYREQWENNLSAQAVSDTND